MANRVLLFMGMKPDRRLFRELLPLLPDSEVVDWIEPLPRETLVEYSRRLAEGLRPPATTEGLVVVGASFGGVVAQEVASYLRTDACVVVSSIRSPAQLPCWLQSLRPVIRMGGEKLFDAIGNIATRCPAPLRGGSTAQLARLAGPANRWRRWAMTALMQWSPTPHEVPTLQIHGDQDTTFPIQSVQPDIVICGGGHLLPLTHAREIAAAITRYCSQLKSTLREQRMQK